MNLVAQCIMKMDPRLRGNDMKVEHNVQDHWSKLKGNGAGFCNTYKMDRMEL